MVLSKINRNKCILDNKSEIEPYFKFQNFPVKMGCTDINSKNDLYMDMEWGVSKNGIIQLTSMVPLDVLYSDSHNPGTIGKAWKNHHDGFANFIKRDFKASQIIEIGGASGLLVDRFLSLESNFKWDIIEPSDQSYPDERVNHYKIIFEDFDSHKQYDLVVHSHLLEHIYDPISFLLKVNKIIKIGGAQFISVPNIPHYLENGYSNGLNFEHTYFYDYKILDILLKSCGFEIVDKVIGEHSIFLKTVKIENIDSQGPVNYNNEGNSERLFKNYLNIMNATVAKVNSIKDTYKKIYIFGGHIFSQSLLNLGLDKLNISGILDNDPHKQEKRLYGTDLNVYSPIHIKNSTDTLVIVKAGAYTKEITNQLKTLNKNIDIL